MWPPLGGREGVVRVKTPEGLAHHRMSGTLGGPRKRPYELLSKDLSLLEMSPIAEEKHASILSSAMGDISCPLKSHVHQHLGSKLRSSECPGHLRVEVASTHPSSYGRYRTEVGPGRTRPGPDRLLHRPLERLAARTIGATRTRGQRTRQPSTGRSMGRSLDPCASSRATAGHRPGSARHCRPSPRAASTPTSRPGPARPTASGLPGQR
jgi:hypothetical protein